MHGSVGATTSTDLVIRGDRYARRARAFVSVSCDSDRVTFRPEAVFQLVPGAYNRVALNIIPKLVGLRLLQRYLFAVLGFNIELVLRRVQVSVVDADSRELISAWVVIVAATAPAIMRSYDVALSVGHAIHKKIAYTNPWDVPRRFVLSSSDESIMRPR